MKILKRRKLRRIPNGETNVTREIHLLQKLNHPNVIRLVEVFSDEEKGKLYMVLDYCLAGLQYLLEIAPGKKFPEFQAQR